MTTPQPDNPRRVPRLKSPAFFVWCEDGADAAAIREAHLDGHLAYVEANHDRYLVAGPLRRDGQDGISGSLFIIIADSESAARAFMESDPYAKHGAYRTIEYRRLTPAAGVWMGGVIWESADELRAVAAGGTKTE